MNTILHRITFRQRQFFALILLAFVPILLTLAFSLPYIRNLTIQRALSQLNTVTNLKSIQILQQLDNGQNIAILISDGILHDIEHDDSLFSSLTTDNILLDQESYFRQRVDSIIRIFDEVESISLVHPETGVIWYSSEPLLLGRIRSIEASSIEENTIFVGSIFYSIEREAPIRVISVPLLDEVGKLIAIIVLEMNTNNLQTSFQQNTGLVDIGNAYLIEANGYYVTSSLQNTSLSMGAKVTSSGIEHVLASQNGSGFYLGVNGTRVLGVYRWLPEAELGLIVEIEESKLIGEYINIWKLILAIEGFVLLLTFGAARGIANGLMKPLEKIIKVVQALKGGDLSKRTQVMGSDEVAQLAQAFDEMADSIQDSQENLEKLVFERTKQLASERNLLRTLIDAIPDYIFAKDKAGKFLISNIPHAATAGLAPNELIGKTATEVFPDNLAKRFHRDDEQVLDTEQALINQERMTIGQDELTISVLTTKIPIYDSNEEVIGLVGISRDITQRKQAEEHREQLIAELQAKNAELEQFTYTVSHDLKSPLITIRGFLGFLEKDALDGNIEAMKNDMSHITKATDIMQQLLSELLELSRIGRIINPSEQISIEVIANEALNFVSDADSRDFSIEIMPNLPTIYADRMRVLQIFGNLISNAIKFSRHKSDARIEVGVREDKEETIIYVQDNGTGILPKYHENVFGLFNQLDQSIEGTGIGLAIVKRIIEASNGRIWVESEGKDMGCTFCFTFPQQIIE